MADRIRILLVDDHVVLRQGTGELLRREPDLEVVGEAGDGRQAIEMAARLKPDIVVMDVRMPNCSGIEATRQIRETVPGVQVLVLTAYDDDQYVFSLLQCGASGYLLKTAPIRELIRAIHQVYEGESPLDPAIAHKVVARFSGGQRSGPDSDAASPPLQGLSARELEVLQLLARGLNNRAIADELYLSDRTVQAHLGSIFSKMGVASRLEAVLMAIRRGWLTLEP